MTARRVWAGTGLSGSALGFGVSGPLGSPIMTDWEVARLVRAARELGTDVFDTAPFYGLAERRLGRALRGARRDGAIFVTKAGKTRERGRYAAAFSPEAVLRSIEASRQALAADRIDALLLHGPDPSHLTEALREALERARERGWIGAYGVCGRGAELETAVQLRFGSVLQCPAHTHGAFARAAAEAGFVVLAIEAMRGAGAGAHSARWPRSGADLWYLARRWRSRANPEAMPPPIPGDAPSVDVRPIDALRAALAEPAYACVLTTTTRLAHLRENAAALEALR